MKQALISPTETVSTGYRVAQVVAINTTFEVADPLFWTSCNDDVIADLWYYDPSDGEIKLAPPIVATAEQNKARAISELSATDWVNEPDVFDETLTPHLLNRAEYLTYRSQLRSVAIAPTAGNLNWPTKPNPQWS